MPNPKPSKPYLLQILEDLCPEFGASMHVEPKYGYAGYIEFPSGRRRFFRRTSLDINGQGASTITKDKDYCIHFLGEGGYHVPEGVLLFSPRYRADMKLRNPGIAKSLSSIQPALDLINRHEFPVFVKPNEGSGGNGVHLVQSFDELFDALLALFPDHPRVLVQRPVPGRDYRVVVLENEVMCAYERRALSVESDGTHSLGTLIDKRIKALGTQGGGKMVALSDPRIADHLQAQGLEFDQVVEAGRVVNLLPNANLSTGGEAIDITGEISPRIKEICVSATRALGLIFAGVDILCEDATMEDTNYTILEINSAPGLYNFSELGQAQDSKVRMLYGKLMEYLAKTS